jgi:hypothetical protein
MVIGPRSASVHRLGAHRVTPKPARTVLALALAPVAVCLAGIGGLWLTLVRNDVFFDMAHRSGREADYLAVERLMLGGPPPGTLRAVGALIDDGNMAPSKRDEDRVSKAAATVRVVPLRVAKSPECRDSGNRTDPVVPTPSATAFRATPVARVPSVSPAPRPPVESATQTQATAEVASTDLASPYEERLRSVRTTRRDEAPQKTSLLDAIRASGQ